MSKPILSISRDGDVVKNQALEGEADLGRGEGCVIRLDDRAISRQHAVFRTTPEGVQIQKTSDFAPLTVNGVDCTSAIIREGDVIAIGPYRVRLQTEKITAPTVPPPHPVTTLASPALAQSLSVPESMTIELPSQGLDSKTSELKTIAVAAIELSLGEAQTSGSPVELGIEKNDSKHSSTEDAPLEFMGFEASAEEAAPSIETPEEYRASSFVTQNIESAGDDEVTKIASSRILTVGLVIPEGQANVTELELDRDETTLGRDKDCELVLSDKKSSRRHASIFRAGIKFVLRDLSSANGTYVNGIKVTEQELYGGDRIRIGACEIEFRANSSEYAAREKNFMPLPCEPSSVSSQSPGVFSQSSFQSGEFPPLDKNESGMGRGNGFGGLGQMANGHSSLSPDGLPFGGGVGGGQPVVHQLGYGSVPSGINHGHGIPGMGPVPGLEPGKKTSLFQKYRSLPPRRKLLYTVLILAVVAFLLFGEDEPTSKKEKKPNAQSSARPNPSASGVSPGVAFESLTPDQKKFVEFQHEQAFTHLKNKEYDKAIFEIRRIFPIVPDYKDSREIERYSVEGKRKLEALEEERRKKALEEKLKAEVAQLVAEVGEKMNKKQYELARELFSEILARDPENQQVAVWKREVQDYEDLQAQQVKMAEVRRQVNLHAWEEFNKAKRVRDSGKCRAAIPLFGKVAALEADDRRPAVKAKAMIAACRKSMVEAREPLLQEAKSLEDSGEFAKAWESYRKATVIDPDYPVAYEGMDRVRKVLHNRAKDTYTEAVLAESYSDFRLARKKYKETMTISPPDDIYYERSQRKLGRWLGSKQDEEEAAP